MGNKFGSFATEQEAVDAIMADGFSDTGRRYFSKKSKTGGNLMEEPRACMALVEITSYRVDGKYAADGRDYHVYQHHFI